MIPRFTENQKEHTLTKVALLPTKQHVIVIKTPIFFFPYFSPYFFPYFFPLFFPPCGGHVAFPHAGALSRHAEAALEASVLLPSSLTSSSSVLSSHPRQGSGQGSMRELQIFNFFLLQKKKKKKKNLCKAESSSAT